MTLQFSALLTQILDESDDAILIFDADGNIIAANSVARELCFSDPSSDLQSFDNDDVQLMDSLQDKPLPYDQLPHRKLLAHGTLNSMLVKIVKKSGKSHIVNVTGEVIRDKKGNAIACLLSMRDLAVRKHFDDNGKQKIIGRNQLHRLDSSDLELESFIYSVSHDLQAPLRHILGFSGLLNEEYASELALEGSIYVDRIREACRNMQSQIFALLQLSRQTRGRMFWGTVNLSAIAEAVIEDLNKLEPERAVKVKIQKNLEVQGDQRLLIVLIEHLLGNAWKFTSKIKKAFIEFHASEVEGGGWVYHISDNGVGFDASKADRLFLPFRRFHGKQYKGSGIGLATALRVINRHNGKIWLDSKPNEGTTVHFTLG